MGLVMCIEPDRPTAKPVGKRDDISSSHDVDFEVSFRDEMRAGMFAALLKRVFPEIRTFQDESDGRVVNCSVLIVPNYGTIADYEAVLEANALELHGHLEGWAIRE